MHDRHMVQDYLIKSGMDAAQADALSRILADMELRLATKQDLAELRSELSAMKADLTWRMIAVVSIVVGVFGTVFTLLNAFVV
jgi:hypothetical protein